jgi:serine/threonine protein kinase
MGEVYLARDAQIDRQVAAKVIRGEESSSPDSTEFRDAARLFQREALAITRLNHPRILPLFDDGEEVTNDGVLIYQCCAVNQWCTDVGKTWSIVSDIKQTTYTFNFVGAQPGRWCVLAVDASGQKSPTSGWWTFTYTV